MCNVKKQMETVFKNTEDIKKSDIPLQIGRAILFILICFFISRIRFINEEVSGSTIWIVALGLFTLFVYLILTSKTLKSIEKDSRNEKLRFVFQRQLRNDFIVELKISEIQWKIKKRIARTVVTKVLHISDQTNSVKINTKQKGISETELNKIITDLKNTTHNNI